MKKACSLKSRSKGRRPYVRWAKIPLNQRASETIGGKRLSITQRALLVTFLDNRYLLHRLIVENLSPNRPQPRPITPFGDHGRLAWEKPAKGFVAHLFGCFPGLRLVFSPPPDLPAHR